MEMNSGIFKVLNSSYWKNVVWPPFKKAYPIDAYKVEQEMKGVKRPLPAGAMARGLVEEIRLHYAPQEPSTGLDYGLWGKPTVLLHNARGGVEYQEEQVKYFGSALLDLNSPYLWDDYRARANSVGLKTFFWRHCHTYGQIKTLLNYAKGYGHTTAGVNLEDMVTDGMTPQGAADAINSVMPNSILLIPTLGWIQNMDWSPLKRHVFQLEIFLNDPPPDWNGLSDVEVIKRCAYHARECGITKLNILCGIYDARSYNPRARMVSANEYLSAIKSAGELFGGIYLGDNNGANYSQWAV